MQLPTPKYFSRCAGSKFEKQRGDCACGSSFPLMEIGHCRSSDLIKTRSGKSIHPSYFNRLLYGQTGIRQYQYIQSELGKITLNIVAPDRLANKTLNSLRESVRKGY
jgi:phenylacetate-CoA ligase